MHDLSQKNAHLLTMFRLVKPGMEIQGSYKINTQKYGYDGCKKYVTFSGPVIQKTRYLIVIRDNSSKRVHSLSLRDCLCGYGKFKVKKAQKKRVSTDIVSTPK